MWGRKPSDGDQHTRIRTCSLGNALLVWDRVMCRCSISTARTAGLLTCAADLLAPRFAQTTLNASVNGLLLLPRRASPWLAVVWDLAPCE